MSELTIEMFKNECLRTYGNASAIKPGVFLSQDTIDGWENALMGLNGEAGELIDHWKKARFQGHKLDVEVATKELGDILYYWSMACYCLGIKPEGVMRKNIEKLRKRYPDGFDAERSRNREETKE